MSVANAALFVGWGDAVNGRERQSNEVFAQAMQYLGRLQ